MRPPRRGHTKGRNLDHGGSPDVSRSTADPMLITSGAMLCRLRVWTDDEWEAMTTAERPSQYTHVPGLGWVGEVTISCLN